MTLRTNITPDLEVSRDPDLVQSENLRYQKGQLDICVSLHSGIWYTRIKGRERGHLNIISLPHTVKPVLETTYIKRPPDLRDHCSVTATLLKST